MKFAYLSWEAFATLVTGLVAFGGAVWIGLRQARISAKQSEILEHQIRLERAGLRLEMFDRRYPYVNLFNRFLRRVRTEREAWTDIDAEFLDKSREAAFFFPRNLEPLIDKVWQLASDYQEASEDLSSDDGGIVSKARERRSQIRADLSKAHEEFLAMCEAEMRPFGD